jgi:hypothetical protein
MKQSKQSMALRSLLPCFLLLCLAFAFPATTQAQGCTQCRDNTAATPPATQRAYRHGILLLTLTAGGLFVAGVSLLRRNP